MSSNSNYNRRGGSNYGNRRRNNNRRGNSNGNWREEDGGDVEVVNNNAMATARQEENGNGSAATTSSPEVINISSSSSDSSSGSTAIFKSAEEEEEGDGGSGGIKKNITIEEISSEEEEEDDEVVVVTEGNKNGSVVNASLIVNLSNANVSEVIEEVGDVVGETRDESVEVGEVSLLDAVAKEVKSDVAKGDEEEEEEDEDSTLADSEVEKLMSSSISSSNDGIDSKKKVAMVSEGVGLPSTVTVLRAPNGVVVYLIGTAHFSEKSHVDVANTIQMTRPTIVLLELCSSRRNILDLDEETVLREASEMSFQKVRLALSNSGTVQGTLHLLLLSMSAQLTKKLGMAPGGEFRVATREARKIPNSVILLGDRPFNITISRALAALTVFQKIKLAWQFLTCNEDITREEIEKCKEKDLLERMLTEMTGEFPSITEVFVNERDVYLAHSLYLAATSDAHRSNGGPVVGVVGMGHVAGIVRNWGHTTDRDVDRIIRIPETPISTIIIRHTFKALFYGAMTFTIYKTSEKIGLNKLIYNSFFQHDKGIGKLVSNGVVKVSEVFKNKRVM